MFQSNVVVITSFLTIVILLGAGVWYASRSEKFVGEAISNLGKDRERVFELQELLSALKDMETGQRGFIITNEEGYLEPWKTGKETVQEVKKKLDPWLSNSSEHSEKWLETDRMIDENIAILDKGIRIRKEEGFNAAQVSITDERGKNLMDAIRRNISEILGVVTTQSILSDENAKQSLKRNTFAISLLSIATVAMTFAGIFTLISAIKSKNEALSLELEKKRAERADHEKSKFLASMSHEIRTPLNAMLGFGELLEEEVEGERASKYVDAIRTSGEGLLNLINDILDLSKIEAGALELAKEPVVVRDFADSIKLIFSQKTLENGLDFEVVTAPECPDYLVFDPFRVRQVLTNLIANAIKFTEKGSVSVQLSAEPIEDSEELVNFVISVKDTGRGIPKDKLKQIFKPFKQVEAEDEARGGTGLGLSICRRLASLMGGSLKVESEWQKGSTFSLLLPETALASDGGNPGTEEGSSDSLGVFKPSKILIVDDNKFNRELLAGFFHGTDHTVTFATNGREGIEQTVRQHPDVVLMDIRMPEMGGQEAFQKIKAMDEFSELPIIAVTASSLLQQEVNLRKKFDGYLRKPFSRDQLVSALEQVLPKRGETSQEKLDREKTERIAPESKVDPDSVSKLVKQMKAWQEERVSKLAGAMVLGDITVFAEDLLEAAKQHEVKMAIEYASELKSHSESFKLSAVETMLDKYSSLVEDLESLSDDITD